MANRFYREFDKQTGGGPPKAPAGGKISLPVVEKTSFPSAALPGKAQGDRSLGVKKVKVDAKRMGL
jgi:hypothetical protein